MRVKFSASLIIGMMWVLFSALNVHAQSQPARQDETFITLDCEVTPAIGMDYLPSSPAETSNNLRRKEGAGIVAEGTYIEIKGRVFDRFCVPVSNALVYLWQTDKAGNYLQYYTLKSEWDLMDKNFDPNFAYSGTARTDNRGEFYFVTIFPGAYDQRAPHLNMRVQHRDFEAIETQLFFKFHPRNKHDAVLQTLSPQKKHLLLAEGEPLDSSYRLDGRRYNVTITLDGENRFQRY